MTFYRLTSSLADRINFNDQMFAFADECIRRADVPVWEIDVEEFARERFALAHERLDQITDDVEEAEARFIDAFRRAHHRALRSTVVDTAAALGFNELVGLAEADFPFERLTLLQMPTDESLDVLDEAARHFGDEGDPDGDLLLAPAGLFSIEQLDRAVDAGGQLVDGYAIPYPCGVDIELYARTPLGPGWVALCGWCGYSTKDVAYALDLAVAAAVYAASVLCAREEEEES